MLLFPWTQGIVDGLLTQQITITFQQTRLVPLHYALSYTIFSSAGQCLSYGLAHRGL